MHYASKVSQPFESSSFKCLCLITPTSPEIRLSPIACQLTMCISSFQNKDGSVNKKNTMETLNPFYQHISDDKFKLSKVKDEI